MVWKRYRDVLVPNQIESDGSTPREEARTQSLHYVSMNLDAFACICRLAAVRGIELWSFQAAGGRCVAGAVDHYLPYLTMQQTWTGQLVTPVRGRRTHAMALAGIGLQRPDWLAAYAGRPEGDGYLQPLVDMLASMYSR